MDIVRELLRLKNFPKDAMKSNGVTALGIAAHRGSIEMMQALVDGGCDIKHTNNQGIGPIFMAIKANQIDSIRFLLGK